MSLSLAITPGGHLRIEHDPESQVTVSEESAHSLRQAFAAGSAEGLLALAAVTGEQELPASLVFWRGLTREFFNRLCQLGEGGVKQWASLPEPDAALSHRWVAEAPPMRGLEYLTVELLGNLWRQMRELSVTRAMSMRWAQRLAGLRQSALPSSGTGHFSPG